VNKKVAGLIKEEGLTVYQTPPMFPRIDYPEPQKVSEPYALRFSRLQGLVGDMKKRFEFADLTFLQIQGTTDPQFLELLNISYRRQIDELERMWKAIHEEAESLKNGDFTDFPSKDELNAEEKKEVGKAAVTVLIFNAPTLQTPMLKNTWGLWEEQLRG
jgi:hypothetical protein